MDAAARSGGGRNWLISSDGRSVPGAAFRANGSTLHATVGQTIGLRLHGGIGAVQEPGQGPGRVLDVVAVAAWADELMAVYRAVGAGQTSIVIIATCSGTGCAAAMRFRATVVVSPPPSPG